MVFIDCQEMAGMALSVVGFDGDAVCGAMMRRCTSGGGWAQIVWLIVSVI